MVNGDGDNGNGSGQDKNRDYHNGMVNQRIATLEAHYDAIRSDVTDLDQKITIMSDTISRQNLELRDMITNKFDQMLATRAQDAKDNKFPWLAVFGPALFVLSFLASLGFSIINPVYERVNTNETRITSFQTEKNQSDSRLSIVEGRQEEIEEQQDRVLDTMATKDNISRLDGEIKTLREYFMK